MMKAFSTTFLLLSFPPLSSTAQLYSSTSYLLYVVLPSIDQLLSCKEKTINQCDGLKKMAARSLILLPLRVGICVTSSWVWWLCQLSTAEMTLHDACMRLGHKKACDFHIVLSECLPLGPSHHTMKSLSHKEGATFVVALVNSPIWVQSLVISGQVWETWVKRPSWKWTLQVQLF